MEEAARCELAHRGENGGGGDVKIRTILKISSDFGDEETKEEEKKTDAGDTDEQGDNKVHADIDRVPQRRKSPPAKKVSQGKPAIDYKPRPARRSGLPKFRFQKMFDSRLKKTKRRRRRKRGRKLKKE